MEQNLTLNNEIIHRIGVLSININQSRTAKDSQSTENVQSELGINQTNPWIARHFVWNLTESFREILIFNYCKSFYRNNNNMILCKF